MIRKTGAAAIVKHDRLSVASMTEACRKILQSFIARHQEFSSGGVQSFSCLLD
jgi:hypothetical protein